MFKELSSDVENFVTPDHGCLIGWAEQGLIRISFQLRIIYFRCYCNVQQIKKVVCRSFFVL